MGPEAVVDGGEELPERVALPTFGSGDTTRTVLAGVRRWITSPPLRRLVTEFGGDCDDSAELGALLNRLLAFSADHWDFRRGRERADSVEPEWSGETAELVISAAGALGLSGGGGPVHDAYDHILVLGGLTRTCLARTWHAAQLLRHGVSAPDVAAIGGFRALTPAETEAAVELSLPPCRYEVDVLTAGLGRAFGTETVEGTERAGDPATDPNRSWSVTTLAGSDATRLRVVAAPSSRPRTRRADTADTIRFWADRVAGLSAGDRVLVVTSPLYVPFQHCDAIRTIGLRYDCRVETVGLRPDWLPANLRPSPPSPGRYLQEIRSTLWSMRRLVTAIEEAGDDPVSDRPCQSGADAAPSTAERPALRH